MQSRWKRWRLILSSEIESDNEDGGTHLPPSDPPSESSDDNGDDMGGTVQTSDDIPLIGLLHHIKRIEDPTSPFRGRDSPNPEAPFARGTHFRPRSSSLPIPETPSRRIHHTIGLERQPLLAPDFGLITPRTQKKINYAAGQLKRRETLTRQKIVAEERHKAKKSLHAENDRMRKALFLDDVADMLQEKLTERGYSLADFLDHIFNPDRKFVFDWRWKGFFAHKTTVQRILEYWTTSKYSQTARALVLDFATSLIERTVG